MAENEPGDDPERGAQDGPDAAGATGRMRFQDESTTPREPTLAERKARERALRREQEEQEARDAEEQRSRTKRKRVLVGAGVTVGVVALIAVGYAVAQPDEEVQAQCVGDDGVIVDDANCVTPASTTYYGGGGGFYPIFIGAGGRQYHYNYGGSGTIGSPVSGGTTTVPREGTRVRTTSGRTPTGEHVGRQRLGLLGQQRLGVPRRPGLVRRRLLERRLSVRRATGEPRPGWEQTVLAQGMVFGAPGRGQGGGPRPYWDESVHYVFEMDEILSLEADVEVVHSMCLQAVDHVVTTERFRDFALPEWCWEGVAASWRRSDPHVYGRFDLRYDGSGPAKLLEYNADTPTTLLEASILQWNWLKDVHPDDDQWNSLHEKLVERWAELKGRMPGDDVYFTWSSGDSTGEDHVTVGYLQETAAEAGLNTVGLAIEQVGWDVTLDRFVDLEEVPMAAVFKLYPWEWVLDDDFGKHVVRSLPETLWVEPLWKTLLSNKALLAVLWEMFPGHPNLLPAYLDEPGLLTEYVRKPRLGREGANISIVAPGSETSTGGVYGEEGYVYQLFDPLPEFDGYRPALGAWIVGDAAAGLGIRETVGLVTDDGAAFVPHRIPL